MSGQYDEQRLEQALGRAADSADLVPSSLREVQARARGIQRRRTAVVLSGAAAAVVVAAGAVAVLPTGSGDRVRPAPAPTSQTPTPSPTASGSPSPTPTPTTPTPNPEPTGSAGGPVVYPVSMTPDAEGTTGGELPFPYQLDDGLVDPATAAVTPVPHLLRHLTHDSDTGTWGGAYSDGSGYYTWEWYDASGTLLSKVDTVTSPAVTPDGRTVALPHPTAQGWVVDVTGPDGDWTTAPVPPSEGFYLAGFLPDGSLLAQPESGPTILSREGNRAFPGGFARVQATSPVTGLVVVETRKTSDPQRVCWGLARTDGTVVRQTCDVAPVGFNGDGTLLYGWDAGMDNPSELGEISIIDAATLEPVATFRAPHGGMFAGDEAVWAGDTLVVPVQGRLAGKVQWTLALLSRDGVTLPRSLYRDPPTDTYGSPFGLPLGPLG